LGTRQINLTERFNFTLKYGDAISRHGSDIISVDVKTGQVTLWDSKFRSNAVPIKDSPTFTSPSTLNNAKREAKEYIEASSLPEPIRTQAWNNVNSGTFNMNTAGAGKVKNSIQIRWCNDKPC
jgi:filamentous hemagglutinin